MIGTYKKRREEERRREEKKRGEKRSPCIRGTKDVGIGSYLLEIASEDGIFCFESDEFS